MTYRGWSRCSTADNLSSLSCGWISPEDQGFHLYKSHLADPERLERLMMAACLAYIWVIHMGCMAIADGWVAVIHRIHRCDLSLFQLGLRLRDFSLNEVQAIPVAFQIILFDDEDSVR